VRCRPGAPLVIEHPVVACSSGPESTGAVRLASILAELTGSALVLATAYVHVPTAPDRVPAPNAFDVIRRGTAEQIVEAAHGLLTDRVAIRERVIPTDRIPEALAKLAREVDASALVVGRDLDGHIARYVLARSPCPVVVVPQEATLPGDGGLREIGVAYDGSECSRRAVTAAQHLAIRAGARLTLITVGPDAARVDVDAVACRLTEAVDVDVCRPLGLPARRLTGASQELDLLVCGSHSHRPLLAKVLGSVSGHLTQSAHCAVLVVPARCRHHATTPLGVTTAGG
jgi:nucleotide-binding universal stress UspA family protein